MALKKFKTGAIRHSGKGKLDFIDAISWSALHRYVVYMDSKKIKFGVGNFKKGIPIDVYEKALVRHLDKYLRNKYEKGNDEKNQDHLSAIVFNAMGIIHQEEQIKLCKRKK